jgi:hypothetical protein
VRMSVVETMPGLRLEPREVMKTAAVGGKLELEGEKALWGEKERVEICKAFGELEGLLGKQLR